MIVESLTLKKFRNHDYLSYDFSKNINVLSGPNGIGKTNVMEAIYFLSLGRSFRAKEELDLIKEGEEQAEISATIKEGEIKRKIKVLINKKGKQVYLNNKPISRLSELIKVVNVILFEPIDVLIFRGSPKNRRNFLNISIAKKYPKYLEILSDYDKLLKARNDILKKEKSNNDLLEVVTNQMVEKSQKIVEFRTKYVKDINDILIKITRTLTGAHEKIEVKYSPFVELDENFKTNAKKVFDKNLENDILKGSTNVGVHREDFSVELDDKNIAEYGSQGENRICALALKLTPYFLIADSDKKPIVVLDDVMSELDKEHRNRLVAFLKKFEQVFITATKLEIAGASQYTIKRK